jgi:hypothetical protein
VEADLVFGMSINKYQRVRISPKDEVEAEQKQTRSRLEADPKRKWKQTRSKMTGIGILCQPKYYHQNYHCELL